AQHPRIKLTKIDIDTPAGYRTLHLFEEQFKIPDRGDLTVTIGQMTLSSKGERNDVEKYFPKVIDRALGLEKIKGRLPADAVAYAKEIFGADATVAELGVSGPERNNIYYRVTRDGKDIGYVVDAFQVIECPICADAQLLMAIKAPEL